MKLNFRLCLIIEVVVYDEFFCSTIVWKQGSHKEHDKMKSVVMGEIAPGTS